MTSRTTDKKVVGAVLVVGGGVAGVQSALDLAESGYKVYLVEKNLSIGGVMAQLDKTFPTNDCSMCILAPKLVDAGRHHNIEILTCAEVERVEGEAGNFTVVVKKHPRYVDIEKCTACDECTKVCPIELPNRYDENLGTRKAIYKLFAQAIPNAFAIEKRGPAPCKSACPIETSAQGYVALIRERKFEEAYALIRSVNPLPGICGRVCHHPCEQNCQRNEIDEPVAVAALKRFAVDYVMKHGMRKPPVNENRGKQGKHVAIIGSGPAGLACANDLALLGYDATVYESVSVPGGMLAIGIPDYRLPPDILESEINEIKALGVEININTPIGTAVSFKELHTNHDAVFVSVGTQIGKKLGVEGEDQEGMLHAVDFLRKINLGEKPAIGGRVAVIGGGNAAIDAARTALRLGAEQVFIVYRRSRVEMPANASEVDAAEDEGITIHYLAAPARIIGQDGKICAMQCIRMKLGEPDTSGRRRPIPIEGSEFTIEVDTIIPAISQEADLSFVPDELKRTRWGTLEVDDCYRTSMEGVFAGGDVVLGPATVIEAIDAGKRAALAIHQFIQGEPITPRPRLEKVHYELETRPAAQPRTHMAALDPKARRISFDEVELGFTEEEAVAEASRCLKCGICSECYECVKVCEPKAINHDTKEEKIQLNVGSVVLAPGFDEFDPTGLEEYGYRRYANVLTSIEFERMMGASGPFMGHIQRLSDGKPPRSVAFLQCIGSRDTAHGREYCSSVCCMYATKEAVIAKEHQKGLSTTIFMMDMRAYGKGFDQYYERAQARYGVRYVRARVSHVTEDAASKDLILHYEDEDGALKTERFDLVVLSVGLDPPRDAKRLADTFGIDLNTFGFSATPEFAPIVTARQGVYVAGAFQGPKDIPETVMQASAAAAKASEILYPARNTLVSEKIFPPERDVRGEPPRIGVFICHCGINIAGVVDVESVLQYTKSLPFVVYAERNLFTCAQDTQELITKKIKEHNINRVVVASCSPRTHEPLFQQTIREAGLNPYLFEMANIRDQCSWVHMEQPREATEKAKDLVRMAVEKACFLEPLERRKAAVTRAALVIGGGLAGMTAALNLANQGYHVALVEKEPELGGNLRHMYRTLSGADIQDYLKELVAKVTEHQKISVFSFASVEAVEGYIGNFESTIAHDGTETKFKHGVVIIATGASEKQATEYDYGTDPRIITQRQLEEMLETDTERAPENVVMIQCVGSRTEERSYCSRVCCAEAIKNALALKAKNPTANIFVLYRDMRTFGFLEQYYTRAREAGVLFIRYTPENPPRIEHKDAELVIITEDPILHETIAIPADLLVLSMATVPHQENKALAQLLKVPLNNDGFFLEAHMKLRPVDFATDGIFLCGMAHAPKLIDEAIAQAEAAAARAGVVLSKNFIETEALVSHIDERKCKGCGLCVEMCAYKAIEIDEEKHVAVVNATLCKGCGVCASSCRSGAPNIAGFTNEEIVAQLLAF
jgi:heterodisulfide reductase subunit A-like polyferredoxin